MRLFKYKPAITVIPGSDNRNAAEHFDMEMDCRIPSQEKDFEVVVPHEDFIKLFRLARLLGDIEHFTSDQIGAIVETYAKQLGYNLTTDEIFHGIIHWSERFADMDDEDIENWLI